MWHAYVTHGEKIFFWFSSIIIVEHYVHHTISYLQKSPVSNIETNVRVVYSSFSCFMYRTTNIDMCVTNIQSIREFLDYFLEEFVKG